MNVKKYVFVSLLFSCLFSSCLSTSNVDKADDSNFIADMDPVQLENIMCLRPSFGKPKPTEIEVYFVPRTNTVEMYLRDDMTAFVLMFDGKQRDQLFEGIQLYAQKYAEYLDGNHKVFLDVKPKRKTSLLQGEMYVAWGVAAPSRNNKTNFYTNHEYLEPNKPYFQLLVDSTHDKNKSSVYSPALRLYFSPTHLENLLEQISNENLHAIVAEKEAEAYAF